ncbi:MAG TPA: arginine deiminase family protein [Bryobacteraceae bacterium]|nr:arginine deiminase family protein [Bryobacteraceae bacterium]
MLAALTRAASPNLDRCELTFHARQPIDIALAIAQHHAYEGALTELGLRVISLPPEPDMPDSMFVEDPILVLDELAILTRMGAGSRAREGESIAAALAPYRPIRRLTEPATLEGGDVIRIDRELFAGLSTRTNQAGIEQLRAILEPFGYRIHAVPVDRCLHLKSAACSIGDGAILANTAWLDTTPFPGCRIIPVPPDEPGAANVLRIGDTILMPACFPQTAELLSREGLRIRTLDISELMKAEAAVTCSSVIFQIP